MPLGPLHSLGSSLKMQYIVVKFEDMQLLLDKGADVNAQGGKYGTALRGACTVFDQT